MQQGFVEQGLVSVAPSELMIRMHYQSFEDYWARLPQAKDCSANS